jgi:hypothetical protein
LGDKLYALYIFGAAAFPDTQATGDIDFHIILKEALTEDERCALEALHVSLASKYPPLGGELDGYYLLLADARLPTPPASQMSNGAVDGSWALHCAHILAGRVVVLHGPDPHTIYPQPSWQAIEDALLGELEYVHQHLNDYPDYCILNLCRLVYSFETRDVVISKAGAARWALEEMPEWRRQIELAQKSYAGEATVEEREFMLKEVGEMYEAAVERLRFENRPG